MNVFIPLNLGDWIGQKFIEFYNIDDHIIHICFLIIVSCFASAIIVTILLFTHRVWMQNKLKRKKKLEDQYSLMLTEILFEEQDENFEQKKKNLVNEFRRKYMRTTFNKRVLRKQLLFLHKNFSGPSQDFLRELYYELNLHKSAVTQLQNTDWSEKADAVRELSQMDYETVKDKVSRLTLHENRVLRLEAQAAMLSLNEEEPFGFLAYAVGNITEWQQLNLEEQAKRLDLKKIPNFAQWFTLKNQSVVEFCVKMTVAYNQFESADALLKLLQSKNNKVLNETVKAVGTMLIDSAQQTLIDLYPNVAPEIKDNIIVSLGKIGGEESVIFLTELLYTDKHEFALKAGKALYSIGFDGDSILQEALTSEQEQVAAIALHVLDDRI
jgi:HEAT repeat protein